MVVRNVVAMNSLVSKGIAEKYEHITIVYECKYVKLPFQHLHKLDQALFSFWADSNVSAPHVLWNH